MEQEIECTECFGTGWCEYDKPVVDWRHYGFIDTETLPCETCNGSGEITIEIEEDE